MISMHRPGTVIRFAGNPLDSLRSWQVWDLRGPLRCYVLAVPVVYAAALRLRRDHYLVATPACSSSLRRCSPAAWP